MLMTGEIIALVATFSAGTFFGAAVYISLAQHPATLKAGGGFGGRFFPPMYRRASAMQIALAIVGTLAGMLSWWLSGIFLWLIGALLLISVVPVTLIFIKPVNDMLLDASREPDAADTEMLLRRWGPKHWVRSILSGVSFIVYLVAYA